MKHYFNLLTVAACLFIGQTTAAAQEEASETTTAQTTAPAPPRWASEKGYWVVESNIHIPKQYTIRFYNNDQVMVYKEEMKGVKLKIDRRKTKMHLKQVLETAVLAWNRQHEVKENEGWVATRLSTN